MKYLTFYININVRICIPYKITQKLRVLIFDISTLTYDRTIRISMYTIYIYIYIYIYHHFTQ